jgi:hypothetical protein
VLPRRADAHGTPTTTHRQQPTSQASAAALITLESEISDFSQLAGGSALEYYTCEDYGLDGAVISKWVCGTLPGGGFVCLPVLFRAWADGLMTPLHPLLELACPALASWPVGLATTHSRRGTAVANAPARPAHVALTQLFGADVKPGNTVATVRGAYMTHAPAGAGALAALEARRIPVPPGLTIAGAAGLQLASTSTTAPASEAQRAALKARRIPVPPGLTIAGARGLHSASTSTTAPASEAQRARLEAQGIPVPPDLTIAGAAGLERAAMLATEAPAAARAAMSHGVYLPRNFASTIVEVREAWRAHDRKLEEQQLQASGSRSVPTGPAGRAQQLLMQQFQLLQEWLKHRLQAPQAPSAPSSTGSIAGISASSDAQ